LGAQKPSEAERKRLREELLMEIVSVGPEWSQKVVCGSCKSTLKVAQTDLGWFKKTNWDRGHLGFRCGHCKTAILFETNLVDGKDREWVFAECEYPPIHIGQSLKNKKVESI
jgi:hypothetical protein